MKTRRRGFTLVEIMIVVVIVGLLAAMAIPAFQKSRARSQATRIANDMNKVSQAFEILILERKMPSGIYSTTSAPSGFPVAEIPEEMDTEPLGSGSSLTYDISAGLTGAGNLGVVLNSDNALDDDMLEELDDILDDGNTGTGNGTKRNVNQYVLIVGQI